MPPTFDESWYLQAYADVEAAVRSGTFASGYEHFVRFGAAEGRHGAPVVPEALLASPTTDSVYLEMTSRCNLRCVYCAVSQPTYHGIDLPLEGFANFVEQLRARSVRVVTLNGHGETTIVKGWETYAERLADAGFRLHVTTNLAKRLKPPEVAALSRFERILVSVDTFDPELLASLRRGARLDTILANLAAIQERAAAQGRQPQITISCTVGDLSAPGIAALVAALLPRGITSFRFGDLVEYAPIDHPVRMRHVAHLPPDELRQAREGFRRAVAAIEAAGGSAEIDAPLVALLLHEGGDDVHAQQRSTGTGEKSVHYQDVGPGSTRDCLDPWRLAFVQADASVRPCCFFEEKLGSLATHSLGEIVEGEGFRALREEIATGRLRPSCAGCNARPVVGRAELQARLDAYLASERRRAGV